MAITDRFTLEVQIVKRECCRNCHFQSTDPNKRCVWHDIYVEPDDYCRLHRFREASARKDGE